MKILIWDNDGTVTGSTTPNDPTKVILPNVAATMKNADFNFIISGFKSPESEMQNFDSEKIAARFAELMIKLPINAAAFSPAIGGVECHVIVKTDEGMHHIKAHEDSRYEDFIGKFKKPEIGMFVVMQDIAQEFFGADIMGATMIGDTWHDKDAAEEFGIEFCWASKIHEGSFTK